MRPPRPAPSDPTTMIPREAILKIIEAGAQAPSGSNSQPWQFEISGDTVSVRMLPEKDHPVLNVRRGGTLIANGALLENIAIAADHEGFRARIDLFPEKDRTPNLVARVTFESGGSSSDAALYNAIWRRATNRKPYETGRLDGTMEEALRGVIEKTDAGGIALQWIDTRKHIEALARAAAVNEAVMFGNAALRRLFFDELVWTEAEEKNRGGGLYLPTMELAPQQQSGLKLLHNRLLGAMLAALGIPRKIAAENAAQYACCAVYGAVSCGLDNRDFVRAGRVIERAWLTATSLGLSFHLQTGVNFLWLAAQDGNAALSAKEIAMVNEAYGAIRSITGASLPFVPALFRIGWGGEPSARSIKRKPDIIVL